MDVTLLVILFGAAIIFVLTGFAGFKLQNFWKNTVCIHHPDANSKDGSPLYDCTNFKELNADFMERRNEFWSILCQVAVVLVTILLLTVLLLSDKISAEAALPIMSGLGSFVIGKNITAAKNKGNHEKQPNRSE
jgi:hypothetical protein